MGSEIYIKGVECTVQKGYRHAGPVPPGVPDGKSWNREIWEAENVEIWDLVSLEIEDGKLGFRTAWFITGHKRQGVGLQLKSLILTFRDTPSHLCQTIMNMAVGVWELVQDMGLFKTILFVNI